MNIKNRSTFYLCGAVLFLYLNSSSLCAYEVNPGLHLTEILSPKLAQSLHHRVDDVVVDGRFFNFYVESDYGVYNVRSMALLRIRVNEINTLGRAIIQFESRDKGLSNELRGQLRISADSAMDIISRPVSSAANLAGQLANNLNKTLTGSPEAGPEKSFSYTGGESIDPTTAMHKRNVASQWALDVYSTNPKVQEFLNAVAKARSSGRISAGAPAIGGHTGVVFKGSNRELETEISFLLKSKNAADLRIVNNRKLADMNIRPDIREKFLQHEFYSPRHKTRITHYLDLLDGVRNRSTFVDTAIGAKDEIMSLAYEESAMMLVHYHQHINKLAKLHAGEEVLQVITQDNRILYFAPVDVVYWSESTERLFDSLLKRATIAGFNGWELITTGSLTEQARSQLQQRRFILHEKFIY